MAASIIDFLGMVRVNTATTGTADMVLGSAYSTAFMTEVEANAIDQKEYSYVITDNAGADTEEGHGVYTLSTRTLVRNVDKSKIAGVAGTTKLSLTGSAVVRITPLRRDLLPLTQTPIVADVAQSLDATQAPQARTNIHAAHISAMAVRNAVINPAVDVSQELGTAGATLTNNTAKYTADQWEAMYNHGAATAVVTSGQVALSGGTALAGFQFGHQIKATTAITSPANGDFAKHRTKIEGYRVAHWGWGAAGAAPIVYAIELYSTASGVALLRFSNSAGDRFYYLEVTVAAGFNFFAGTLAGDTSGTWLQTNGVGLVVEVFVSGKETTPQSSLGAWGSTAKVQSTNSTNLLGTNNNLTILTGVYVDVGTQLPTAAQLPLLMRPFDQELLLCKRQLELLGSGAVGWASGTTSIYLPYRYSVQKRATPTLTGLKTTPAVFAQGIGYQSGSSSVYSFSANAASDTEGFMAQITGFSGLTTGNPVMSNDTDIIKADARL